MRELRIQANKGLHRRSAIGLMAVGDFYLKGPAKP